MIFTCIWLAYGDNDDDTDNDNDFDELHHDERLLHLHVVGWSRSEPDPAFRHIVVLPHKISGSSWSSRRSHLTPFYYLHHQGFLIFLHLWFPDLAPRPLVLVRVHHRSEPRLQSAIWFYSSNDYYDDIYIMMQCLSVCVSQKIITSSWESPVTTWTPHNHPLQLQVNFDGSRLVFHGSMSVFIGF